MDWPSSGRNPVSAGPVARGPEKRSFAARRRQPHRNQLTALILRLWGNGLHHTTPAPFTSESRNPRPKEHRGRRASSPMLPGAPLSAGSERTPPPHLEDPGTCSPSMHPQHSLRRGPAAPGTPRAAEGWVTRAEGFGAQPPPPRAGGGSRRKPPRSLRGDSPSLGPLTTQLQERQPPFPLRERPKPLASRRRAEPSVTRDELGWRQWRRVAGVR